MLSSRKDVVVSSNDDHKDDQENVVFEVEVPNRKKTF